jgi:hypothetical protein
LNCSANAGFRSDLLPIRQQSLGALSSLGYQDYKGLALNDDTKPRLIRDLGDKNLLMLRNHWLLAAPTVADAIVFKYLFETSCMMQNRAQSGGGEPISVPSPVLDGIRMAAGKTTRGAGPGEDAAIFGLVNSRAESSSIANMCDRRQAAGLKSSLTISMIGLRRAASIFSGGCAGGLHGPRACERPRSGKPGTHQTSQ